MAMIPIRPLFCLTCVLLYSLAHAQTTVTLNGKNYSLRSHPRVLMDGCHWTGAWSPATQFQQGDGVERLGVTYRAIRPNSKQQPPDPKFWVTDNGCGSNGIGTLTSALHASQRATAANPAFDGMEIALTKFKSDACGKGRGYECDNSIYQGGNGQSGQALQNAALLCFAQGAE